MSSRSYLIIAINLCDYSSTGNMMLSYLEEAYKSSLFDVLAIVPESSRSVPNFIKVENFKYKFNIYNRIKHKVHRFFSSFYGLEGNYYVEYSRKIIKIIKKYEKKYDKTIVHLHNLHHSKYDVNYLYKHISSKKRIVFYTLHDCWPFTGGCHHYSAINCKGFIKKCIDCPMHYAFSSKVLKNRIRLIKKIKNLTLIAVSHWMYDQVKQSHLKNIPTIINYGGTIIKPFSRETHLREMLNIENQKIILAVSAYWNISKGINFLYELADLLPNGYILVIVGGELPKNHNKIIHVNKINDPQQLSEYYYIADVFVSVTQAEALGLVTCEAQICGTPVVGFGNCGSIETITHKSGVIVENKNINALLKAIVYVIEKRPFTKEDIVASGERFIMKTSADNQLKIYKDAIKC